MNIAGLLGREAVQAAEGTVVGQALRQICCGIVVQDGKLIKMPCDEIRRRVKTR